ncbi:carbohydrate-binding module family 21 protein [Rhodotorula graminis WP1]|uniref:Carbohydrate-binding module family 21 protein n=1 Tax=Rhodotorula graminis (strain WP1) TaxID=578459 RepID=A0A194S524_RHOGW|nr:carbohydrate-binding module family 21 protein [Rhodotorula graminis WP1]KPV75687.1 carbohydrate-binding module family 21 protein [Rhodotorula graminis WP1]
MPYVGPPSSSSSPVATMSFAHAPHHFHHTPSPAVAAAAAPRAELKRPARHHHRSHSSDPIASTSNYIFVQPATPDDKGAGRRAHSWMSSAPASAPNGRSDGSTSPGGPTFNTLPRQQRRMRLTALTPAASAAADRPASMAGPSSQDESSDNARAGSPRSGSPGATTPTAAGQETPRATAPRSGVFDNAFPFGHSASASASSSSLPSPTLTDDMMVAKPALMVRKKSGELVRPSLKADTSRRDFSKPRSAPATPLCPKYVHFDTQLEHVKHFLAQQRPAAVSRTGSPIETETEDEPESFPFPAMARAQAGTLKLVLPNFPTHSRTDRDAYVESLTLTPDGKAIRGIVRVRNLAFEKWVAVRFTLDTWQTVSEVSGEHHESLPGGQADRFVFTIRLQDLLANIDHKVMYLAIRYTAGGRETWDNNDGQNYRVEFKRVPLAPTAAAAARAGAAAAAAAQRKTAWSVTNAGQAADRMADLRRELDRLVRDDAFDDDETAGGATGDSHSASTASSSFSSATHNTLGLPAGRTLRLGFGPESRSYSETHVSGRGEGPAASLSGRYDFGNSLKMFTPGASKDPATAKPFFDPVSTSPQRSRAPPLPNFSPSQQPHMQLVGGQPGTVFDPSLSAPINSHRVPGSPLEDPRAALPPDFGASSTSALKSKAYFSPTLPSAPPRPHSPLQPPAGYFYGGGPTAAPAPPGGNVGGLPYLPLQDSTTYGNFTSAHTRYSSHPGQYGATSPSAHGLSVTSPRAASFSPLVPPAFREGRGRNSPFSSPAPSPPSGQSPAGSPPRSSSPLPQVGNGVGNGAVGRKLRSPPPSERSTSAETSDCDEVAHPWSPATDSTSSTISSSSSLTSFSTVRHGHGRRGDSESSNASSVLSSPESDATSVGPDSPSFPPGSAVATASTGVAGTKGASMTRPSNALEFSNFLDRYRFHLGAAGGGNSASAPVSGATGAHGGNGNGFTSPASQAGFFNFSAASPLHSSTSSSSSTTPHSPVLGGGGGSPTSQTGSVIDSNSSTPQRLSPLAGVEPSAGPAPALVS